MTNPISDKNYNATAYFDDGTQINVYASKLHYLGLANFQGWDCLAGSVRICILPNGSVYSAECENDYLGNLTDDSFDILQSATICKQKECNNNPDDAMTKKYFSGTHLR